ncbi:MAG: hypothetical protein J6V32_02440 [Elusimicrobiaceae bacterium]|nr:hypothetical protein [Elusimicrobiaceae bacterium]
MITKISICNLALAQLGQSPISSLEQENEKARRLNLFYAPVRDEVLRTHNWAFAGVQEPLVLFAQGADEQGRFIYKYPAEALFIRRVFSPAQKRLDFQEFFRSDLHSRVILTVCDQAQAEYTRRITDENLFDTAFIKSFSLALACDLAVALTSDTQLAAQLLQRYALSLEEARRSNASEIVSVAPDTDAFTEVR